MDWTADWLIDWSVHNKKKLQLNILMVLKRSDDSASVFI